MRPDIRRLSRWAIRLSFGLTVTWTGVVARAQERPPAVAPSASVAPAAPPAPITVEELAERLRAMEEMNRRLAEQLERTNRAHEEQVMRLVERVEELSSRYAGSSGGEGGAAVRRGLLSSEGSVEPGQVESPVPDYTEGQFAPNDPAPGYPLSNLLDNKRVPITATFGPGFELESADEEFLFRVHLESQVEGRVWGPEDQSPANAGISGVYLPRQRIFFDGNITKRIEYELSINRGLSNINILNAYLNLHLDDRLQFRFGRFFTPLPFDQYAISNYWLLTPERSLFTTNVGLNRQFGAMAWGYLFDERLDYAAGFFNGSRNSFENTNNAMDFVGYLNARPFQESEALKFARFLNIGTSVAYGYQDQAPSPVAFRIGGGSPDTSIPGSAMVPFLILNRDVIERGDRLLGSVHAAYFYKGLSVVGEWQYGYGSYSTSTRALSTRVPFSGYYVAAGYFLTGEHVERRTRLYPLRPLIPTNGRQRRGLGAVEVAGRVSRLGLGESVFTAGFADPDRWSDSAVTTEFGLNWYWNEYIKLYCFWLHGRFGDPIRDRDGGEQETADMFWLRLQLYF